MLRSDYGTENPSVATTQIAFRMNDQDTLAAEKTFVYGPSPANVIHFVAVTWSSMLLGVTVCRGAVSTRLGLESYTYVAAPMSAAACSRTESRVLSL